MSAMPAATKAPSAPHNGSDAELALIAQQHQDILQRARATQQEGATDPELLTDAQAMDWGLHDRMVDALGNDIISELYRVNTLRVRLIRLEHSVITPARLIPAMQEHLHFIAALQQRNSTAAVERLQAHIRRAHHATLSP